MAKIGGGKSGDSPAHGVKVEPVGKSPRWAAPVDDGCEIGAGVGCDCRSTDAVECRQLWLRSLPHANPAVTGDMECLCVCHETSQ